MPNDDGVSDASDDVERVQDTFEEAGASRDGFIYFRMSGGRFDSGKGMPASAAVELQRYSELVYEVARLNWLDEHPGRSAVRGLRDAFDLRLVAIEEGSAQPVFRLESRFDPQQTQGDPGPLFIRARDIVNETIATVAVDGEVPPIFPRDALPHLKRIGKALEEGEAIALAKPRLDEELSEPDTAAVLTARVAKVIADIDVALLDEPTWADVEGVVTEFDGSKGTFRLDLAGGHSVECHLGSQEREVAEAVKAVLAADGVTAPDVTVGGTAERSRNGELRRLWDVNEVTVVRTATEKALMARLSELGELDAGWSGEGSRAPGQAALRHAQELGPRLALSTRRVAVGADGDGSVVLEWWNEQTACTAEIQANGDMYLFADHTDTDTHQEFEGTFDAEMVIRFVETGVIGD
ncbi:hypothetical protein [Promicromonospora soli]